ERAAAAHALAALRMVTGPVLLQPAEEGGIGGAERGDRFADDVGVIELVEPAEGALLLLREARVHPERRRLARDIERADGERGAPFFCRQRAPAGDEGEGAVLLPLLLELVPAVPALPLREAPVVGDAGRGARTLAPPLLLRGEVEFHAAGEELFHLALSG